MYLTRHRSTNRMGVHVEVLLAARYALFLASVALSLDFVARHSRPRREVPHRRVHLPPNTRRLNLPRGLEPHAPGDRSRTSPRPLPGQALICNSCPSKQDCTDSDKGREISRALDPWPHSEAGRFHHGISLVVASIAFPLLAAEAIRNQAPSELAVLGTASPVVALATWRLHAAFRAPRQTFRVRQQPRRPGYLRIPCV